jgi:hypothetical protein
MIAQTYINAICRVGQQKPCGSEASHLMAVTAVTDTGWSTIERPGGIVGLCDFHATTPVSEWHKRCEDESTEER